MKNYEVKFLLNGEMKEEAVIALSARFAMEMIESKYPNAVAYNATNVV